MLRPELVAGVVLVESAHEDQWTRLPPPLTDLTKGAVPDLRAFASALRSGAEVPEQPVDAGFTDTLQRRLLQTFTRLPGQYEELANVISSMDSTVAMLRRSGSLGDLPLLVISADRSFDAFRHLPIDAAASNAVWADLQRELTGLSRCSRQLRSATGDHRIMVTNPDFVVEGIQRFRAALRARQGTSCPLSGR
jgi:pimeloyl-ACP methyl ester carboxylesterase